MKTKSNTDPRSHIVQVITKIYLDGMTTTSGGNISLLDEEGNMWITPSAIDKGKLTAEDIVCVKKDGSIEGKHKPSSEYPFHRAIYEARPDIKSVIHAHPPALVTFSILRQIPDTSILPHAQEVCGSIGYADYALPGSNLLGEKIAQSFAATEDMAVIMENHGVVLGGSDLSDAYARFEMLENCCDIILKAKAIGSPNFLSEEKISQLKAQKQLAVNTTASSPSEAVDSKAEVVEFIRRANRQKLISGSFGAISVRTASNNFITTPSGIPFWMIEESDLVEIVNGEVLGNQLPSDVAVLHQETFIENPEINVIISAQSPNLMAFASTARKFDVRTIPESWIFLQDVPCLSFEAAFSGNNTLASTFAEDTPAVLVANHSFTVTGKTILQTFDRLEVAEFSAKSLVAGAHMGDLVPIGDEHIEDLREKFL
ncbi:class II aldolase/adducin family protein [Persicobacter diffluens]|uniref:L-fuculose-phosphate aldolase n=1 Tax=Persicobacter diffluens TaxID=981 RepID=A0AAN5AM67_9BACT|nr:L-fuculose-phosphate aldolase [Persicobacter diffluens]